MAYFSVVRHPLLDNRYARSSEVNFARVVLGARDMTAAKVGRTASFDECTVGCGGNATAPSSMGTGYASGEENRDCGCDGGRWEPRCMLVMVSTLLASR